MMKRYFRSQTWGEEGGIRICTFPEKDIQERSYGPIPLFEAPSCRMQGHLDAEANAQASYVNYVFILLRHDDLYSETNIPPVHLCTADLLDRKFRVI